MMDLTKSPAQLKASILQDAMMGKLTQQLPEDGDAKDLLTQINAEKDALIKAKKIKQQKALPEIEDDEIPFEIPDNWQWVRLGDLTSISTGLSYKKGSLSGNVADLRIIRGGNISNGFKLVLKDDDYRINNDFIKNDNVILKENQLLTPVSTSPKHTGKVAIVPKLNEKIAAGGFIYQITPIIFTKTFSKFLMYALSSPKIKEEILSITNLSGSALYNIPKTKFINILIPLPNKLEQERIVDKIDSLLPKVDEFNKSVEQLHNLREELPSRLRRSFLQSAMMGKLTKQLPEDGDASELLDQIKAEKEALVKAKKIKSQKPLPEINADEIPFEIPDNWRWVRLGEIASYIQRGKSPKYGDDGIKVLSQKCVTWNGVDISKARIITKNSLEKYDNIRYLKPNDILWNSTGTGTLGRVSKVDNEIINIEKSLVVDSHVTVIRALHGLSYFILKYLSSPQIQDNLNKMSSGSTNQTELSKKAVENVLIPLPPLPEQKRIVKKLDKLLDELKG